MPEKRIIGAAIVFPIAIAGAIVCSAARAHEVPPQASGPQLLDRYGCTACHSVDGSASTGPTFKGLYGSKQVLETGQTVSADEAYLRESIEHPEAKVVKTFAAIMPQLPMPPANENSIVEYLKTLR